MIHINSLQSYIFEHLLDVHNMESRLIVKNFGPIKDVNLTLKNVNVFIGPQATGKSALAKIYTIFKAPRKFFYKKEDLANKKVIKNTNGNAFDELSAVFKEYNIDTFLNPDTEIEFESELHTISFKKGVLFYHAKLREEEDKLRGFGAYFSLHKKELVEGFNRVGNKFVMLRIKANSIINKGREKQLDLDEQWPYINEATCEQLFNTLEEIEEKLSTDTASYIPAERGFVNIIKKYALNLLANKVPIPQHILNFGAEIEKLNLSEIKLDFITQNMTYRLVDGEDRIYIDENKSIMLTEASSGVQSVVPLLSLTLNTSTTSHKSFVIEEPELNLFPIAQYELIKLIESRRNDPFGIWEDVGTIHTYTTHSPYILSSLNNLLYAYKVYSKLNESIDTGLSYRERSIEMKKNERKVKGIVKAMINPKGFTAYQINNGYAESIFNEDKGLISDNFIDMASDKVDDDFDELMELLK